MELLPNWLSRSIRDAVIWPCILGRSLGGRFRLIRATQLSSSASRCRPTKIIAGKCGFHFLLPKAKYKTSITINQNTGFYLDFGYKMWSMKLFYLQDIGFYPDRQFFFYPHRIESFVIQRAELCPFSSLASL